jgi:superfamily II DNA or RNA helicase
MKLIVRDPAKGYLDNNLWLPKSAVNVDGVKGALTFMLPDRNEGIRVLSLWRETATHLVVPREFWDTTTFDFPIVDCRPASYEKVDLKSRIVLDTRVENGKVVPTGDDVQQKSMNALLTSRGGILQLACGKGKTVVAIELIARRAVPAIIIVDTSQLVKQWRDALMFFLNLKEDEIGMIGDGSFDWKKAVVIATYTTLGQRADMFPEEARRWFGTIVWDEAHHVAAPTFARTADLFAGMRLGLTATPDRDDGMHVVYNHHIGKVLYKNLTQDLKPRIYFKWTGLSLDPLCAATMAATKDSTGEYHVGKIAGFFGRWRHRLEMVLNEVKQAVAENRKILVLSNSVDEVVNLLAMWNGQNFLYSDIPFPAPADVGETVTPFQVSTKKFKTLTKNIAVAHAQLQDQSLNPTKRQNLEKQVDVMHHALEAHRVWKKCEARYRKLQKQYIKDLLAQPSTGGIMIYKVNAETRSALLKAKQVTFAISKYGREGLDESSLDTVIVCEPMSSRNALQQLMGRAQRQKSGKQSPVVVFLEDDIGPMIGMCKKLRSHLREWPVEEGGPYEYELLGHPITNNRRQTWAQPPSVRASGS